MDRTTDDGLMGRRQRAAVLAALWTAILYATIPVVRAAQGWIEEHGLTRWITPAVVAALLLLVAAAALHLLRRPARPRPADLVWLGAVAAAAGVWAWRLRGRPEEAVHLLQYGVLCWLIYQALRPAEPNLAVLLSSVLLGTIMGTVDEIIQWITPARFWDLRDVALNAGACVLGAVVAWRLDARPWRPPDRASVRLTLRLAATLTLLITATLANTPHRVAWYAARIPGLGFLAHPANEMAEYGDLHRLPGVGAFKSRLTRDELAEQDRRRGGEAAAIIDRYPVSLYTRFLWDYQGFQDPLVYESRIHVFSRNNNAWHARQSPPGSNERRRHATVAYRENQLIEAVFPNTLARSAYRWDRATERELRKYSDPDRLFTSRVGAHLITCVSESALRAGLLLVALALVAADVALGSRRPQDEEENP
jgi:hypothetical protein